MAESITEEKKTMYGVDAEGNKIDLSEFAGVNLGNVTSLTIGVGTRNVPGVDATGTLYFDDIRLIQ